MDWLRSFLSIRSQIVEINQQRSSSLDVKIGVPQGSMLGPLLIILYVNDSNKPLIMLTSINFDDDTTLHLDINPSNDHASMIVSELAQVQTGIYANELSLNVQKTNYLIISNRNQSENIRISLSGQPVARFSNHKFLGVSIGDKLKFNIHIDKLSSKVSQSTGTIRRISHPVPKNVFRILCYTLIYPRLTYTITAWGLSFNSTTRRIESLASRAITLLTDPSNTNQLEIS